MDDISVQLQKVLDYLRSDLSGFHIGRANTAMVDEIPVTVVSYGSTMPLKSTANISCPDAQTLRIEPWDKSVLADIEKALRVADIGNPQNMGDYILIKIPPMTEERRVQLVKQVHARAEQARISVRNIRQDALKKVRMQKDEKEISEDIANKNEKDIQEKVDAMNSQIDEISKKKEADILHV